MANVGRKPTFEARGTSSVIDITLTLNTSVDNWEVPDITTLSDHNLIEFDVVNTPKKLERVYNFAKTDWGKFREVTEAHDVYDPLIISEQWLEQECDEFITVPIKYSDKGIYSQNNSRQ